MAKFIATFNDTIDDIELNGFKVLTEKDVEEFENMAYSITWPFKFKIGEYSLEYSSGEDLLSKIDFREISFDESKTLKKLFNNEFGFFIGLDFLESIVEEEEDYNDNDNNDEDDYNPRYDDDYDEYDDEY